MALPIAQLGYIPNVNTPNNINVRSQENVWEQFAAKVLAQAVGQMTGNLLQRDYASQASQEAPEQVSAGPMISPETGKPVSTATERNLAPQNAPWWSRMLQGPQMGQEQYGQVAAQRATSREKAADRTLTSSEGAADRTVRKEVAESGMRREDDRLRQAGEQFNKRHDLDTRQLSMQQSVADRNALLQGGELANQRERTDIMRNPPEKVESMNRVISQMATDIYKTQMEQWNARALIAQNPNYRGPPVPPQPTLESAMEAAVIAAEKLGYKRLAAPVAPPVPLIQ